MAQEEQRVDGAARRPEVIRLGEEIFHPCPEGALWHPLARMLVVADLHLEKGSSFAQRGRFLPPYDTAATLTALGRLIARLDPAIVVALGDSFHDRRASERIAPADVERLCALQRGRDWVWIAGNHDPERPACVTGEWHAEMAWRGITFRHEPEPGAEPGEIAGHLHPVAKIVVRGAGVRRRCIATDGRRAILPAFGAYAGGLNLRDRAFADIFHRAALTAWMLGDTRTFAMPAHRLVPDAA
jgi:uncharacterized protein